MADMIVPLYALDEAETAAAIGALGQRGVVIRRALAAERRPVVAWVASQFGDGWVGEAETAFSRTPTTCLIAIKGQTLLGFACFDVAALGFFGPTGVDPAARGGGIGAGLLKATLSAMRATGYAYAIIGGVGPADFYTRIAGAMPIPGSTPGIYAGQLRSATPAPAPHLPSNDKSSEP